MSPRGGFAPAVPPFGPACPREFVPGCRHNQEGCALVDVYEFMINGAAITPGYTEVNETDGHGLRLLDEAGRETRRIGEEFLRALEHGKPPAEPVAAMTKQIAAHTATLATVAKDIGSLKPAGMAADIGVPFHPGAARFYKEAGITVKSH